MVTITSHKNVDLLILGAGWTSTFLIPLLQQANLTYAATTTTGRQDSLKFKFEFEDGTQSISPESEKQLASLPSAKTVLITFPLRGHGQSAAVHKVYTENHDLKGINFIQLGSTGIFTIQGQDMWVTRHSKYDTSNPRAIAEDELIELGGCILNLSGLWGGSRHPRNWVDRVASTKELLESKTSLHLIHGRDVARGIIAVHFHFDRAKSQRFMLTDLMVHDWWTLILGFAEDEDAESQSQSTASKQVQWVGELIDEQGIRALPRSMEQLSRCYDSREFWTLFGLMPLRSRI